MNETRWEGVLGAVVAALRKGGTLSPSDDPDAYQALSDPLARDDRDKVCAELGIVIRKAPFSEELFLFPSSSPSLFAASDQMLCQTLGSITSKEEEASRGSSWAHASWAVIYIFLIDYAFDRAMMPTCRAVERASIEDFAEECRARLKRVWESGKDDEEPNPFCEVCGALFNRPMTCDGTPIAKEKKATTTLAGAINKVLLLLAQKNFLDKDDLKQGFIAPTARGCAAYQFGIASKGGQSLPAILAALDPERTGPGESEDDDANLEENAELKDA